MTAGRRVNGNQIGLIAIGHTAQRRADIDLYHYRWEVDIDGGPHLTGGLDPVRLDVGVPGLAPVHARIHNLELCT